MSRHKISNYTRRIIYDNTNGYCQMCGKFLRAYTRPSGSKNRPLFEVLGGIFHHKIPYVLTQNDNIDNLLLLCIDCHRYIHSKKGTAEYGSIPTNL